MMRITTRNLPCVKHLINSLNLRHPSLYIVYYTICNWFLVWICVHLSIRIWAAATIKTTWRKCWRRRSLPKSGITSRLYRVIHFVYCSWRNDKQICLIRCVIKTKKTELRELYSGRSWFTLIIRLFYLVDLSLVTCKKKLIVISHPWRSEFCFGKSFT